MRLLSPDGACVSVDVPIGHGRRYNGTVLDVTDPAHVRALREVGYTPGDVAGAPARASGFRCTECGFRAFFATCGRCGGTCQRA